jgi:hypothetical protein
MSGIESNTMPFVSTVGFGGIVGILDWFHFEADNENTSCDSRSIFRCSFVFRISAHSECKLG